MILRVLIYPFAVLASLATTVFAMLFVNWWAPLFANSAGNLPTWLYWFQTFDATLDAGWRDGYFTAKSPTGLSTRLWYAFLAAACLSYSGTGIPTGFNLFMLRVRWLYRNPAYGFDYFAFGVAFVPAKWRVLRSVDTPTLSLFVAVGPAFNLEYAGRYGELKLGWKAANYWNAGDWRTTPWGPDWTAPLCFTYSPFKRLLPSS